MALRGFLVPIAAGPPLAFLIHRAIEKKLKKAAGQGISRDDRNVVEFPVGHSAPAKDAVPLRKA